MVFNTNYFLLTSQLFLNPLTANSDSHVFFRMHATILKLTKFDFQLFILNPHPSLPPGGRNKTFPPWGKMKGGKKPLRFSPACSPLSLYAVAPLCL